MRWHVSHRNKDGTDILTLEEETRDTSHGDRLSWSTAFHGNKKIQRVMHFETRNQLVGPSMYLPFETVNSGNSLTIERHVADKTLLNTKTNHDPTADGDGWRHEN